MADAHLLCCIVEAEASRALRCGSVEVETVPYRDLIAVTLRLAPHGALGPDPGKLTGVKDRYQQANNALVRHHTMVPVRFGTVVPSREEAETFLAGSYLSLKAAASRVRGRVQFDVELSWELPEVLQELLHDGRGEGPEVSTRRSAELPADPTHAGRFLFEASERRRATLARAAHERLRSVAVDSVEERRSDASVVLHRSYLIEREAETGLDARIEALGREGAPYLRWRYTGPLPPYSFVPLELRRSNPETIDAARRTLALPERARFEEIRAAYRQMAARHHPDRNPGDPAADGRFRAAYEAYVVLRAYCAGQDRAARPRNGNEYSFAEEVVRGSFLVSDRS